MMFNFDQIVEFFKNLVTAPAQVWSAIKHFLLHWWEYVVISHYGCPNSNRTAKLQLKKRLYK